MDPKVFIDNCKSNNSQYINENFNSLKDLSKDILNKGFIILCQKGNISIIKKFINSFSIDQKTIGLAFQSCAKNGHIELIKIIKDNVNLINLTVSIDIAIMHRNLEVTKYLFSLIPDKEMKMDIACSNISNSIDDDNEKNNHDISNFLNRIINSD